MLCNDYKPLQGGWYLVSSVSKEVNSGYWGVNQRTKLRKPVRCVGRGGISRLAEGGRAMAPRTPPLAERLAEPWEGVKYT